MHQFIKPADIRSQLNIPEQIDSSILQESHPIFKKLLPLNDTPIPLQSTESALRTTETSFIKPNLNVKFLTGRYKNNQLNWFLKDP